MSDKLSIDKLVKLFFMVFTNKNQQLPNWELINKICISEAIIIKKTGLTENVHSLQSFIEPRKEILSNGTLTEFEEIETEEETTILGNIAHRFSKYQKSGYFNSNHFQQYGNKLFQFIKTKNGWKISSVIWEDA